MNGSRKIFSPRRGFVLAVLLAASRLSAQEIVTTFAGAATTNGFTNGPALGARFNDPAGLAVDSSGNLFIADSQNHVIRKLSTNGTVTTFAGSTMGAPFDSPSGIAVDAGGNLFVSDTGNQVIRKIAPGGAITILAGSVGEAGSTNGVGAAARFNSPLGLAVDSSGNLFVADSGNHVIRKITADATVSTFAGEPEVWGDSDGIGSAAHFNSPVGITLAGGGGLFVTDANNHTIRRISADGVVTTFAGVAGEDGCVDGAGQAARFCKPAGIACDGVRYLYVCDSFSHTLRRITLATRQVITLAGRTGDEGSTDGTNGVARFFNPYDVAWWNGGLIVTDAFNQTLRLVFLPIDCALNLDGSGANLSWNSVSGKKYRVQSKNSLNEPGWTDRGALIEAEPAGRSHFADLDTNPAGRRFYRVVLAE